MPELIDTELLVYIPIRFIPRLDNAGFIYVKVYCGPVSASTSTYFPSTLISDGPVSDDMTTFQCTIPQEGYTNSAVDAAFRVTPTSQRKNKR